MLLMVAAHAVAADPDAVRAEVGRLLTELDSPRFDIRRRAEERLEQLVAQPELGPTLAVEFQRALRRPEVSFEVRRQLDRLGRRLPPAPAEVAADVSPMELDRLIRLLDDDSYGRRLGAMRRLDWLLENPKLVCPVMLRLKERLADPRLSEAVRQQIEVTWQRSRGAWLLSCAADGKLPPVPTEQIAAWADALTKAPSRTAERELLDLLARDEYVPRVKEIVAARLSQPISADAARRLQDVLDWTRPAMVAEFWSNRRHLGEQHLLVGVPSQAPTALRPSHFDRIDDRTAHCVSGNTLSPGDYPVGVAFPHPMHDGAFFHLVNLPTPRRRMMYTYYVKTDEKARLAAISRRTVDRCLEDKRRLDEREVSMLGQLDAKEVSRFAGRYFLAIDDDPLAATEFAERGNLPSRHGAICQQLAQEGTKEAMPGLLTAIQRKRFLPATSASPYAWPWLAALAIAARDPWPEVDQWLQGLVPKTENLVERGAVRPELGATAAGILAKRRNQAPAALGLLAAPEPMLRHCGLVGYRFASDEARKQAAEKLSHEKQPTSAGRASFSSPAGTN